MLILCVANFLHLSFFVFVVCNVAAFFEVITLQNLAQDGRTIIASIHQPRSEAFELFENLHL